MRKPDYTNSLVSLANSLLKHYGAAPHHATLPLADELLAKHRKNVVLLILDGMGVNVLARNLPPDAFLRRHVRRELSSVFPPTTTAATTSVLTGKTPAEHGWIGWSCYFQEVDKCIDLFSNHESGTETPASAVHQPNALLGYESILDVLRVRTCAVSPFTQYFADTMENICAQVHALCAEDGEKFIYAYHFEPDKAMHHLGVSAASVQRMLADFDRQLEALVRTTPDTLFLITADHGMVDIDMRCVEDYPQIHNALVRSVCVEPRCCSFYVKDAYRAAFPALFADTFGDKFLLLTHDELMQSGLLGAGAPHPKTEDFVGDYVAIAVSDVALWYRNHDGSFDNFKGAHAGLTQEELIVPLIVLET